MLDVSPYSELELSPMDLGDDHSKIKLKNSERIQQMISP